MTGMGRALAQSAFVLIILLAATPASAIQCAPYARALSGLALYGAAWSWWDSADGRYERGTAPEPGAALVFKRSHGMPAGHVAIVTHVVNARVILVDHANWSPIHGHRGSVEKNVLVIDESPRNDWSEVRVWYRPVHDYGNKVYPVYGFIYR